VNRRYGIWINIYRSVVLTASIFVYVCFVDCCIVASLQTVK